jgi:tetratricopeptide (TPR) repeat protein
MIPGARVPWWLPVFGLALALRLLFLFGAAEPLLYNHPYNYFAGALSIAERDRPWTFVLTSDAWHTWGAIWTMAPLYHLFLALVFRLFGPHLVAVQVVQCLLDALTAVFVGALGRAAAGPRGTWAGVVYAVYWPAVQLPSRTLTENLHTFLLTASLALLLRGRGHSMLGGFALGLSALARAISAGFLPFACVWRWRNAGARDGALLLLSGAAAILPWSLRNAVVMDEPVAIETVGVWNLWTDNAFVTPEMVDQQGHYIKKEPTPSLQRAQALRFAFRGLTRRPGAFAQKVWDNARHFFRPEGLQQLLAVELPQPAWRHVVAVVFDDVPFLLSLPPLVVFLVCSRMPVRSLLLMWIAYYLFMVIVVFHNEIRYRSAFVPAAFAGAAGGTALLASAEADARRRRAMRIAALAGASIAVASLAPYVPRAYAAADAAWTLQPARAAIRSGRLADAELWALAAASRDRESVRPWTRYGRWLAFAGHPAEAVAAYQRASLRREGHWVPRLVLPRLLADAGRVDEAQRLLPEAHRLSIDSDPWLMLEVAWRELPPPRANEIRLAGLDYGAVRGFLHPREGFRWSRHRAWMRLVPTVAAPAYDVTVEMGSPDPSPIAAPEVTLSAGGRSQRFVLQRDVKPYSLRVPAPSAGEPLVVSLTAPTWCLSSEPAEQGVRVDRVRIAPVR